MRLLLTDGSSLTAKQTATRLGIEGHRVEVLAPRGPSLTRFTRHVRRVHRVPSYGPDPFAWLGAALAVWTGSDFDVLIPTQEQVAVLSVARERLDRAGVVTAVPSFAALSAVQDKVSAFRTLTRLGLPQPSATVANSRRQLVETPRLPVFVKQAIGTATSGVRLVQNRSALGDLATGYEEMGVFEKGGVLVQSPVDGPLVMVQAVFDHGELKAFHACERMAEGVNGGASHKRALSLSSAQRILGSLGRDLRWHGALSADLIVAEDGPAIIDVNPRLVEPANAFASGVDLVGALVTTALGRSSPAAPCPSTQLAQGRATHQLLLAVLNAAATDGRCAVMGEMAAAATRRGLYRDSTEELTPIRHDWRAAVPVAAAVAATLVRPSFSTLFTDGSVANYALTPDGWQSIVDAAPTMAASTTSTVPGWPRSPPR